MEEKTNEEIYPGVLPAYTIALQSYEIAFKRSDAADNSLDRLSTLASSITIGVIAIVGKWETISFKSYSFYLAIILFAVISIICLIAKNRHSLQVIGPNQIYDKWLHHSEWEFKKNVIHTAGEHFLSNRKYVDRKVHWCWFATTLFLVEMVCLAIWVLY